MKKFFEFISKFIRFFRNRGDDDRKLMEKLRDKYRLVIMNDETFEEVSSLKLTPLAVYAAVSSLIVGTAILVTMLIIWTPLKRYIPGYGDFTRDSEVAELTSKVTSLEEEVEATRAYSENFRKILLGDVENISKSALEKQGVQPDSGAISAVDQHEIDRIPEDEQLRSAVDKGTFTADPNYIPEGQTQVKGFQELPLEQMAFMPPVSGEITSGFDPRKSHYGIDVAASKNTAIKATANGVVIFSGYAVETGYSLSIQHPNNVVSFYKHNSVNLKKAGESVKAGEAVAIVGNTGENTSGPHLHFELWHKGRAVNPKDYINFN